MAGRLCGGPRVSRGERRRRAHVATNRSPPPPVCFREVPLGPAEAGTSHQAHGHSQGDLMLGQGPTLIVHPVIPEPPPPREVKGLSSALRILGAAIHTMTTRNVAYPPLPRPPAADPIAARLASAAAHTPRAMQHVGATNAPLDGVV